MEGRKLCRIGSRGKKVGTRGNTSGQERERKQKHKEKGEWREEGSKGAGVAGPAYVLHPPGCLLPST